MISKTVARAIIDALEAGADFAADQHEGAPPQAFRILNTFVEGVANRLRELHD